MTRPTAGRAALALLLGAFAAGDLRAEERAVRTADGDTVRWDEGLSATGRAAASALPAVRAEVAVALALPAAPEVSEVVLVRGLDRMRDEARASVPDWAVGVAIGSLGRIVVRADLLDRGFGGGLTPVLRHEWVHLAWARYAGATRRAVPLWFEEGLAEAIGGGVSVDFGVTLDQAIAAGSLIRFEDLAVGFPADPLRADLAYKQSRSWVRYLADEKGWPAIQRTLRSTVERARRGESDPFTAAVREETGRGLGEWDAAWRLFAERDARSRLPWLLRDVDLLVLSAAGVACLVAFFFIRRRRRREMDLLEDGPPAPGEAERGEIRGGDRA